MEVEQPADVKKPKGPVEYVEEKPKGSAKENLGGTTALEQSVVESAVKKPEGSGGLENPEEKPSELVQSAEAKSKGTVEVAPSESKATPSQRQKPPHVS